MKKINIDQKAQFQKKPALESQLAQLEEQFSQFKRFDEEHRDQLSVEKNALKAALEAAHAAELQNVTETVTQTVTETVTAEVLAKGKSDLHSHLLRLSKFLRAAAGKRQSGDQTSSENRAFEGALLLFYGGDPPAVDAMVSLIKGGDELVPDIDSDLTDFTCERLKINHLCLG